MLWTIVRLCPNPQISERRLSNFCWVVKQADHHCGDDLVRLMLSSQYVVLSVIHYESYVFTCHVANGDFHNFYLVFTGPRCYSHIPSQLNNIIFSLTSRCSSEVWQQNCYKRSWPSWMPFPFWFTFKSVNHDPSGKLITWFLRIAWSTRAVLLSSVWLNVFSDFLWRPAEFCCGLFVSPSLKFRRRKSWHNWLRM